MFDKTAHITVLVRILKDIYSDPFLRVLLGFKGGTAAYLFYDLPRLSVDLDFDLLDEAKKDEVFEKVKQILPAYGKITEAIEKHYTLFFLLNYKKDNKNIKVEISKRLSKSRHEVKNYLGIPVLLMKKEDIIANKLSAFLTRNKFASRDLFDLWFFLKNDWKINPEVVKEKTNLSIKEALKKAISKVEKIQNNSLLHGLGELVDEKQKNWVKTKLKEKILFNLKLYYSSSFTPRSLKTTSFL